MNALQAFQKVERAATILVWGWMLNNLLGTISIIVLVYLLWWKWHLGLLGVVVLLVGIWVINCAILPSVFRIVNKPFAEMAKAGAVRLAVLGAISEETVKKLAEAKVEHWPKLIVQSMAPDEFRQRMTKD